MHKGRGNIHLLFGGNESDSNSPNSIYCCIVANIQGIVQVAMVPAEDGGTERSIMYCFTLHSSGSHSVLNHCIEFRTTLVCLRGNKPHIILFNIHRLPQYHIVSELFPFVIQWFY